LAASGQSVPPPIMRLITQKSEILTGHLEKIWAPTKDLSFEKPEEAEQIYEAFRQTVAIGRKYRDHCNEDARKLLDEIDIESLIT